MDELDEALGTRIGGREAEGDAADQENAEGGATHASLPGGARLKPRP